MVSHSDWKLSNSALCGWKDQFGNDSPFCTVSRCGQLLTYLVDFGPSSSVSLSQHVLQVSLQTQGGLAALLASKLNDLKPRFPSVDVVNSVRFGKITYYTLALFEAKAKGEGGR